MTKRETRILLTILGFVVLLFVGFWAYYDFSIQESNKEGLEMACNENITHEFEGRIIAIENFDYDKFMHGRFFNLKMKITDSTNAIIDYHYNLEPNTELLEFVAVGQRVIKNKGQNTFVIETDTGERRTFPIAKCADIE